MFKSITKALNFLNKITSLFNKRRCTIAHETGFLILHKKGDR
jgi:hypothetical protein